MVLKAVEGGVLAATIEGCGHCRYTELIYKAQGSHYLGFLSWSPGILALTFGGHTARERRSFLEKSGKLVAFRSGVLSRAEDRDGLRELDFDGFGCRIEPGDFEGTDLASLQRLWLTGGSGRTAPPAGLQHRG